MATLDWRPLPANVVHPDDAGMFYPVYSSYLDTSDPLHKTRGNVRLELDRKRYIRYRFEDRMFFCEPGICNLEMTGSRSAMIAQAVDAVGLPVPGLMDFRILEANGNVAYHTLYDSFPYKALYDADTSLGSEYADWDFFQAVVEGFSYMARLEKEGKPWALSRRACFLCRGKSYLAADSGFPQDMPRSANTSNGKRHFHWHLPLGSSQSCGSGVQSKLTIDLVPCIGSACQDLWNNGRHWDALDHLPTQTNSLPSCMEKGAPHCKLPIVRRLISEGKVRMTFKEL